MRHLQELHEKLKDKGLVILGMNCADDKQIALEFMKDNSARFPNIIDSSTVARDICRKEYKGNGVPINYIIDKEGKVVEGWYGDYKRAIGVLEKLGIR